MLTGAWLLIGILPGLPRYLQLKEGGREVVEEEEDNTQM